jgi:drug/metabolite transporter (DMT)-like permease
MMLGAFYGLSTALTWGIGNVLIKSQVSKLATAQLLTIRAVFGAVTAILAYFFLGKNDALLLLTPLAWLVMVGSVLTGYFGSDLLFVYALRELPLSYVFPIQATYPLIATGLAWFIYGEAISAWVFIGAVLVIAGVSLIGSEEPQQASPISQSQRMRGFTWTALSAVGWGLSAIFLRAALEEFDPVTVNTGVGLLTAGAFLIISRPLAIASIVRREPRIGQALGLAGALGGTGLSNLFYILTIQAAGVAQATVLASTAPLFTSFFAVFFLGERLTVKLTLGTFLTVIGIGVLVGG